MNIHCTHESQVKTHTHEKNEPNVDNAHATRINNINENTNNEWKK